METLKQGLSFLLFASVAWLLWVLAAQLDGGLLEILLGMVAVAFACWLYGRWATPARPKQTRYIATATAIALTALTYAWLAANVL
jgi:thiol:disulfide interchange protein DsbD